MKTITEEEYKYLMECLHCFSKIAEEDEAYYKTTGYISITDSIIDDSYGDMKKKDRKSWFSA